MIIRSSLNIHLYIDEWDLVFVGNKTEYYSIVQYFFTEFDVRHSFSMIRIKYDFNIGEFPDKFRYKQFYSTWSSWRVKR